MFKFFKDKIKGAIKKISKDVEEDAEKVEKPIEEKKKEEAKLKEEEKAAIEERIKKEAKLKEEEKAATEERIKKEEAKLKEEEKAATEERIKKEEAKLKEEEKAATEERIKKEEAKLKEEEKAATEERIKKEEAKLKEEEKAATEERIKKEEETKKQEPKKKGFLSKIFKKKEEAPKEEPPKQEVEEETPEKKSILKKVTDSFTKINLTDERFETIFWELEVALLENNVALEVIEKIKEDLKKELQSDKVFRKSLEQVISDTLKKSISELFDVKPINLLEKVEEKKPYVIAFIGVNGSGKTTHLAKIAKLLQDNGKTCVIAAADTFRAAAIQQLEEHANNLKVKMIKHDYNSDPAAVAFDAIEHAKSKKIDVVLIDTAGRLHSNDNLMNELKKLIKVNNPDMKIFVGESITGNDCVEQARLFDEAVGIDGIILAKADVDEKGGAAVSVSFVTGKPIIYLGVGQQYDDLKEFKPEIIMENLGL